MFVEKLPTGMAPKSIRCAHTPSFMPPSVGPQYTRTVVAVPTPDSNRPFNVAELTEMTVIGNQPGQATLVLADPRLGPRHVEIARLPDGFYARDLGSQAGTSCRGQRLGPTPFKLHNGDVIVLGQNLVALLFEAAP